MKAARGELQSSKELRCPRDRSPVAAMPPAQGEGSIGNARGFPECRLFVLMRFVAEGADARLAGVHVAIDFDLEPFEMLLGQVLLDGTVALYHILRARYLSMAPPIPDEFLPRRHDLHIPAAASRYRLADARILHRSRNSRSASVQHREAKPGTPFLPDDPARQPLSPPTRIGTAKGE